MATSVVEHAQDDREPTADDPPATCTPTGLGCELGATRPALYTDGITEARDGSGEQFGHERLRDCLARCAGRSADEIATEIIGAAREFADGISDDVAVIVLRVPDDLGEDPVERVAAATGVPVAELRLPEYPHGGPRPPPTQRPDQFSNGLTRRPRTSAACAAEPLAKVHGQRAPSRRIWMRN